MALTNLDNDTAGIQVTPGSGVAAAEESKYTIWLNASLPLRAIPIAIAMTISATANLHHSPPNLSPYGFGCSHPVAGKSRHPPRGAGDALAGARLARRVRRHA